jgi:tyrosyl-tRNA synthetase
LQTYLQQAGKIIDLKKAEIRYNSEWFGKLTYAQIGEQANVFSLAEFMARENISKRYKEGKRISLREILYPLMQGYDSVMVKADVELGGTDQRFNLLAGRQLQQHYNQKPQDLIMNNLIEGLDGRKMSSSWGNTINLTDSAKDIFGKIMRLRDESIITYLVHCTRVPMSEVEQQKKALSQGTNPRDIKLFLAEQLVTFYYDTKTAKAERDSFLHQFSDRQMPTDIPLKKLVNLTGPFPDKLYSLGLTTSKSEARRLLEQGAVKINGDKIIFDKGYTVELKIGDVIQVGKRKFIKLVK